MQVAIAPIRRALRPALALAALIAASCGSEAPTSVDFNLVVAERTWAARHPASYDLTIQKSCFCVFEAPGPVVVAVRGGVVTSRKYVVSGAEVGAGYTSNYPTVDELFAIIEQAAAKNPDRMEVFYDQQLGFPVRVAIDFKFAVADDELFYSVTGFQAR